LVVPATPTATISPNAGIPSRSAIFRSMTIVPAPLSRMNQPASSPLTSGRTSMCPDLVRLVSTRAGAAASQRTSGGRAVTGSKRAREAAGAAATERISVTLVTPPTTRVSLWGKRKPSTSR
jgi:hypothetical protein